MLDRPRPVALAAAVAGCVGLAARPPLLRSAPDATAALVCLFIVLLLVGAAVRTDRGFEVNAGCSVMTAVTVGVAAFALGRIIGGGHPPGPLALKLVALNTLAAIAEEAFFRRVVFDALRPSGAAVAVVGSATLFALVHVPMYGVWVLPLDLAAGLLLSWQRWATGSWAAPAVTHVLANLLVVI